MEALKALNVERLVIGLLAAYELVALHTSLPTITAILLAAPVAVRVGVFAGLAWWFAHHLQLI